MTSWSDPVFAELAELATRRAGLAFPPGRRQTAEAAMRHAMQRADVSDAGRYLDLLTTGLLSSDALLFELTVGETYFLRQREHFALMAREIFPDIKRRRGDAHEVQVWSAGCSSGEEAYSVAIALADNQVPGRVLGTDVSDVALAKAHAGVYRPWSLRGLDAAETRRLFSAQGRQSRLDDRYRGTVTFARHNLATDAYPPPQRPVDHYDLVLCRNVLMYLDEASITRVTAGLAQSLGDEGWLLLGASDPPLTHPDLRVTTSHGCVVYRRRARVVAMTRADHLTIGPDEQPSPDASSRPAILPNAPASDDSAQHGGRGESSALQQAHAALARGAYDEVIHLTTGRHDAASAVVRVHALANAVGTVEALSEVDEQLVVHPMSASLHLLRALLLIEHYQFANARQALRRVLYLDPGSRIARALSGPTAGSSAALPWMPGQTWPRIADDDLRDATDPRPLTRTDLDVLAAWSGFPA